MVTPLCQLLAAFLSNWAQQFHRCPPAEPSYGAPVESSYGAPVEDSYGAPETYEAEDVLNTMVYGSEEKLPLLIKIITDYNKVFNFYAGQSAQIAAFYAPGLIPILRKFGFDVKYVHIWLSAALNKDTTTTLLLTNIFEGYITTWNLLSINQY